MWFAKLVVAMGLVVWSLTEAATRPRKRPFERHDPLHDAEDAA